MLMFVGMMLLFLAVVVFVLTAFAAGMSDAPASTQFWRLQWPAIALFGLAAICFIARHFVHGSIQW